MMDFEHLSDDELIAYLDGEAAPEIARLIEATPRYQTRLEELRRLQTGLSQRLKPLKRPSTLTLGEYQLGLLPAAEARAVEAYLRQHAHAARQQDRLAAFLADLEPRPEPAGPGLVAQVKILIAELIGSGQGGLQPAAAGIRGKREGIYQAGDIQIVIETDVDPDSPTRKVLTGLIQGLDPAGLTATLLHRDTPTAAGEVLFDEFGNFMIADLPPGAYQLVIRGGAPLLEIHVQELQV
jgi:hypothetical protein